MVRLVRVLTCLKYTPNLDAVTGSVLTVLGTRATAARIDGVSSGSQTNRRQPILTPAPQRTRPHERMVAAGTENNWRNIMSVRD